MLAYCWLCVCMRPDSGSTAESIYHTCPKSRPRSTADQSESPTSLVTIALGLCSSSAGVTTSDLSPYRTKHRRAAYRSAGLPQSGRPTAGFGGKTPEDINRAKRVLLEFVKAQDLSEVRRPIYVTGPAVRKLSRHDYVLSLLFLCSTLWIMSNISIRIARPVAYENNPDDNRGTTAR